MRDARRFQKGSGIYTCRCCGKRTRYTGGDGEGVGLCDYCYEEGGWENMLSDGECTQAEYDEAIAELRKQYNRDEDGKPIGAKPLTRQERVAAILRSVASHLASKTGFNVTTNLWEGSVHFQQGNKATVVFRRKGGWSVRFEGVRYNAKTGDAVIGAGSKVEITQM